MYERESTEAFRKWLIETGNRPLYTIGPLVPPGIGNANDGVPSGAKYFELAMSENGSGFQEFLDKIMKTHGKQSLTYVSYSFYNLRKSHQALDFFRKLLVAQERQRAVVH